MSGVNNDSQMRPSVSTFPTQSFPKHLICLADGTWQDGSTAAVAAQTNIWRLAQAIKPFDKSDQKRPQVVYYGTGLGSDGILSISSKFLNIVQGATGLGLASKVKEIYIWICMNWNEGDSLTIVGFSRGAYTARTVADLLCTIGILNREQLDEFADIYTSYQLLDCDDKEQQEKAKKLIDEYKAQARPKPEDQPFLVSNLAVFDTVGSLGIPGHFGPPYATKFFGFDSCSLSPRVHRAFQALALNEPRKDFLATKWDTDGNVPNQIVKQTWFAGSHCDIGGGWPETDLAMLALFWLASNMSAYSSLNIDFDFLLKIPRPVAPYGQLKPHNPQTQDTIFNMFTETAVRQVDLHGGFNERLHPTVLEQKNVSQWPPELCKMVEEARKDPSLLDTLLPQEKTLKNRWESYSAGTPTTPPDSTLKSRFFAVINDIVNAV